MYETQQCKIRQKSILPSLTNDILTRSDISGHIDVCTPIMNGVGVLSTSIRPTGNSGIYT